MASAHSRGWWRGPDPAAQSVVRVVFHDRRLQYSEQQQLEGWRWSRPGDRILDIGECQRQTGGFGGAAGGGAVLTPPPADIPLSVGILEPQIHPTLLNTVEFLWDPSRRTSVFVQVGARPGRGAGVGGAGGGPTAATPDPAVPGQVHCISTEFTLRKNGGEKGVPFRIQIDTFGAGGKGDPPEHLHSASCLIKVFKVSRRGGHK